MEVRDMASSEGILSPKLVDRVKAILMKPKDEWRVIDTEPTDMATLYRSYVGPLAAIGPVAAAIGGALIGVNSPILGTVRTPIVNAIVGALVSFALALVAVYIVARVIDYLAPRYSGTSNMNQAFKVAAYASTAQWIAGVFALLPPLAPLSILGLYSFYLLYLGLPVLMKVPQEKATNYTVAVVVVCIVVFIIIGIVSGIVIGTGAVLSS
jgi:ABC-type antimicrobial peptide transport system permease subunit